MSLFQQRARIPHDHPMAKKWLGESELAIHNCCCCLLLYVIKPITMKLTHPSVFLSAATSFAPAALPAAAIIKYALLSAFLFEG